MESLQNYDIFIVCASQIPYTVDEINAIYDWAVAGGSLLLMGDHTLFSVGTKDLAKKFGYSFYEDSIYDDYLASTIWPIYNNTNMIIDEFTFHVSSIVLFYSGGILETPEHSDSVVFTDNDDTTWWTNGATNANDVTLVSKNAFWNNSTGKIAVLSDVNLWDHNDFDGNGILSIEELNNTQLALNIMNWLATPNTITGLPIDGTYLSLFLSLCMFVFIGRFYKQKRKK